VVLTPFLMGLASMEDKSLGFPRVFGSVRPRQVSPPRSAPDPQGACCITETNRIHLVLFGIQNRTLWSYLAAIKRILISSNAACPLRQACQAVTCLAILGCRLRTWKTRRFGRQKP
jgi:hypothetical protein